MCGAAARRTRSGGGALMLHARTEVRRQQLGERRGVVGEGHVAPHVAGGAQLFDRGAAGRVHRGPLRRRLASCNRSSAVV